MKRSTPLRRRKPLSARTPITRVTRLRPFSRKRVRLNRERAAFVEQYLRDHPRCEFPTTVEQHCPIDYVDGYDGPPLVVRRECPRDSVDVHEPLTRARGGSIVDPDNALAVCRWHHDWIHAHPELATKIGLLVPSWERP